MAAVQPHIKDAPSTIDFRVEGMTCGHCVHAVRHEVGVLAGVREVEVDLASGDVTVTSERPLAREDVDAAFCEAGYALVS